MTARPARLKLWAELRARNGRVAASAAAPYRGLSVEIPHPLQYLSRRRS
jgi:hypothetical protein